MYINPRTQEKAVNLIDKNGYLSVPRLQQELLVSKDTAKKMAEQMVSDCPNIKIDE